MQHAPYPEVPPDFGNWLAGFADGEGSFQISSTRGRANWECSFKIGLRFDDRPILEEVCSRTGLGRTFHREERSGAHPACLWIVRRKREVQRLVEVFDAFPLRAKKQRDYLIWREAASYWIALGEDRARRFAVHRGSLAHDWGPMPALAEELKAGRKPQSRPLQRPPRQPSVFIASRLF